MLNDFVSLFFPNNCVSCGKALHKNEAKICTFCLFKLPKTNFHQVKDNPIAKIFWGRTPIHSSASYYLFTKGGNVQRLIHQLKYNGKKEVGVILGNLYGQELNVCQNFNTIDIIIPVPLFPKKLKKRGYNQSEYFGKGLAKSLNVTMNTKILRRKKQTDSQTKISRYKRWENTEHAFELLDSKSIEGKHILLVDDVITTGATLEACANALLQAPDVKVSIATIAYAAN